MTSRTRIPLSIVLFNSYIVNTYTYLLAGTPVNSTRLGILATEITTHAGFETAWIPLFLKYSDKKGGRTTGVLDQMKSIMTKFRQFDQDNHLLDRIAASPNVTITDMETFNIKKGVLKKTTNTVATAPITDIVSVLITPIGGGSATIKCRSASGGRASIVAGADSVQYCHIVSETPPTSPLMAGMIKDVSTKASFTVALGADNAEKHWYSYYRWFNTKHPELAGTWTGLNKTMLL